MPTRVVKSEPRFRGVGLIVVGSLVGSLSFYPAYFGVATWVMAPRDGSEGMDKLRRDGRRGFFFGLGGLVIAGAMLASGIVMNQRYNAWKSRAQRASARRAFRLLPQHQWNGRTHAVGVAGRF